MLAGYLQKSSLPSESVRQEPPLKCVYAWYIVMRTPMSRLLIALEQLLEDKGRGSAQDVIDQLPPAPPKAAIYAIDRAERARLAGVPVLLPALGAGSSDGAASTMHSDAVEGGSGSGVGSAGPSRSSGVSAVESDGPSRYATASAIQTTEESHSRSEPKSMPSMPAVASHLKGSDLATREPGAAPSSIGAKRPRPPDGTV